MRLLVEGHNAVKAVTISGSWRRAVVAATPAPVAFVLRLGREAVSPTPFLAAPVSAVLDLVTLQTIDDDLSGARAQASDVARRLEGDPELIEARATLAVQDEEIAALRREQRRLDGEVQAFDAKIAHEEGRLYGGTVRNPKELQSLQHEIGALKEQRGRIEDVLLPLLDQIEGAAAARTAQARTVTSLEARWVAQSEALREEAVRLDRVIASYEAKRAAHVPAIAPGDYRLYEGLRARKAGAAIARLSGSSCGKCRVALPEAVRRQAMMSLRPVQCPNCERILTQG
jgi:predicted  nucleic acid-binding Zn-ribbon protein